MYSILFFIIHWLVTSLLVTYLLQSRYGFPIIIGLKKEIKNAMLGKLFFTVRIF